MRASRGIALGMRQSLKNRSPNMFTLIGLGVWVAYGYSVIGTLMPQIFPVSLRTMDGAVPVYFEGAAVITTLGRLRPPHR